LSLPASRRLHPPSAMENIVIGLIALALLVYLVVAVLRPEKF
jgi:K+-transporting ATPase KdpF subunit